MSLDVNGPIPDYILDDLSSRFIINIPDDQRRNIVRLLFQIEQAHWFYLDFYRLENPALKSCGMKEFAIQILRHIPTLNHFLNNIDQHYDTWKSYKLSVPTYGAILLNSDLTKVLLVQSFFEKTSWGFPKGKINEEEDPVRCAAREVFEETGFDISEMIRADEYIEAIACEQTIRLYVIPGIDEHVKFTPQTRFEIKNVEWFLLSDLPVSRKDMTPKLKIGVKPSSFYMVLPFVKKIKNWVQEKKADQSLGKKRPRHKSVGDLNLGASPSLVFVNSNLVKKHFDAEINQITTVTPKILKKSKERKNSRRQLFGEMHPQIVIPQWLNFKLKRQELLDCFNLFF